MKSKKDKKKLYSSRWHLMMEKMEETLVTFILAICPHRAHLLLRYQFLKRKLYSQNLKVYRFWANLKTWRKLM